METNSNWKPGPLPTGTFFWGGVVIKGMEGSCGFFFADFCGDHAKVFDDFDMKNPRRVEASDIAWYNNALTLPPDCNFKSREGEN